MISQPNKGGTHPQTTSDAGHARTGLPAEPRFRIRNFGNCTECADFAALEVAIQRYRGKSVSIIDNRRGGAVLYVDVSASGDLSESYGQRLTIDLPARLGPTL